MAGKSLQAHGLGKCIPCRSWASTYMTRSFPCLMSVCLVSWLTCLILANLMAPSLSSLIATAKLFISGTISPCIWSWQTTSCVTLDRRPSLASERTSNCFCPHQPPGVSACTVIRISVRIHLRVAPTTGNAVVLSPRLSAVPTVLQYLHHGPPVFSSLVEFHLSRFKSGDMAAPGVRQLPHSLGLVPKTLFLQD